MAAEVQPIAQPTLHCPARCLGALKHGTGCSGFITLAARSGGGCPGRRGGRGPSITQHPAAKHICVSGPVFWCWPHSPPPGLWGPWARWGSQPEWAMTGLA